MAFLKMKPILIRTVVRWDQRQTTGFCCVYRENRHYRLAPLLHTLGVHDVPIDEMTGIQVMERLHSLLSVGLGMVQRQEFEYIRQGSLRLISSLAVVVDKIVLSTQWC
ncbi:hypothetical protein [Paenibacillus pseudetheri]|uniref:hypothetical protein n=1 Tax=Paenibacillus pseudetheri TaxID=2897682 RepID=UPI001F231EA4|nr:hypothetical protein [Paenibacillus pseudetheri]